MMIRWMWMGFVLLAAGCGGLVPGRLSRVQPVSEAQRVGNVYLLRGFIGIFSTGIDDLEDKIERRGIHAQVFQAHQWRALAETIAGRYAANEDAEPLVLVGHSYGADDAVRISRLLNEKNVTVDLLVTIDPVTPPPVPGNVAVTYNIYRSNGVLDYLPWFRGIPLKQEVKNSGRVENIDINMNRRDLKEPWTHHFNIEKKSRIHEAALDQILIVCPEREDWIATRIGPQPRAD